MIQSDICFSQETPNYGQNHSNSLRVFNKREKKNFYYSIVFDSFFCKKKFLIDYSFIVHFHFYFFFKPPLALETM